MTQTTTLILSSCVAFGNFCWMQRFFPQFIDCSGDQKEGIRKYGSRGWLGKITGSSDCTERSGRCLIVHRITLCFKSLFWLCMWLTTLAGKYNKGRRWGINVNQLVVHIQPIVSLLSRVTPASGTASPHQASLYDLSTGHLA